MSIDRYDSEETKNLDVGKIRASGTEVFRSLLPVKVVPAADDAVITANAGDRLDALASKFYGTPALWYILASVNNINGSMHIPPGTQLRIPSVSRVLQ